MPIRFEESAARLQPTLDLPRASSPPVKPAEPGAFQRLVQGLGQRVDSGEALLERALHGDMGRLEPAALVAVQAGIYRYVEAVDLTAKLVDRATNAVRTVLQSGSH